VQLLAPFDGSELLVHCRCLCYSEQDPHLHISGTRSWSSVGMGRCGSLPESLLAFS
jgi:hypothetical protein